MKFRFTLSNASAGSKVISEPIGWKGIVIKLLRDPEYHSLIETIDTQFSFYNSGDGFDGGREFITGIEATQGAAAQIKILVEISDTGPYETVFIGNLDLSTKQDVSRGTEFYLYKCDVIPDDNWAKFINRADTIVDLHSTTDVDGNAVPQRSDMVLQMPPQVIVQRYFGDLLDPVGLYYTEVPTNTYIAMTSNEEILKEVPCNNIGFAGQSDKPEFNFIIPYDGYVDINFDIYATIATDNFTCPGEVYTRTYSDTHLYMKAYFQLNSNAPVEIVPTNASNVSHYSFAKRLNLKTGDLIYIYGQMINTPPFSLHGPYNVSNIVFLGKNTTFQAYPVGFSCALAGFLIPADPFQREPDTVPASNPPTTFKISVETVYPSTTADSMLIYETVSALTKRIGVQYFYSEYFGGTAQSYSVDGCGSHYAILLGLHVRGYQFIEKLLSMSFKEWWSGANPIFNLGCGIESVFGQDTIRIEQKEYFYNDTPIHYFSNVEGIIKSFDKSKTFKSIEIGYSNWSAESASGIDDVQTSHKYSAPFPMFGQTLSILSTWVAAALAIEQTRRNRREQTTDWRMDNNVMIVAINGDSSPEVPEQNLFFTSITGLLAPTSRYNIRLSVYRNFQRWIKFLSGGMLPSKSFKFEGGEGNYAMTVGANSDTCDTGTWTENQNISPSTSYYYKPDVYTFTAPLSWSDYKTIRDNRKQCVAVSTTSSGYSKVHIDELNYSIETAQVTIKGWTKP